MKQLIAKTQTQNKRVKKTVVKKLAEYFVRNGYLRLPKETPKTKKSQGGRKGHEIRFVANNKSELKELKKLLAEADFKSGKPFDKFNQIVLPVYGKEQFFRFKELLAELKFRVRDHKK
ncbi:hypothetical protein [Ignavibacterium sp.]|uniref:hypothetical protein n=1 Tax=Ignavibacterium sp. TaxID=2651167 RepID=UPI00307F4A99